MTIRKQLFFLFLLSISVSAFSKVKGEPHWKTRELPKDSLKYTKNFKVVRSELVLMSSVDWDSWFRCYDMVLKSDSFPENTLIKFKTRRLFSSGVKPLLKDLPQIKRTLLKSYPYKFVVAHDSAKIDIHYVNRSALSDHAKKDMQGDMKELKIKYKLPDFKNAVLVTVSYRKAYQRWIVLKDGRSFLWHYKGNLVLDLDAKDLKVGELYTFNQSFKIVDANGKIER